MVKQLTYMDLPLEETDLSIRTLGALRNAGLLTLGDVLKRNIEDALFPVLSGKGQVLYETGLLLRFAEAELSVFQKRTHALDRLPAAFLDSPLSSVFHETSGFAGSPAFVGALAGNGIRTMRRLLSLSVGQIRAFPDPLSNCQDYLFREIRKQLGCPFFVPLLTAPAANEHLQKMQDLFEKSDRVPLDKVIGFDSSLRERLAKRGFFDVGSVLLECLSHTPNDDTDLVDAQYILLNEYSSRYESWYRDFSWAADRLRGPLGYPVLEKKNAKTPDYIWDPETDLWKRSKDNTMPTVLGPLADGNIRYLGTDAEKRALSDRLLRQANARYWVQRHAQEAARKADIPEPGLYDNADAVFQEPDNWRNLFEDLPLRDEGTVQRGEHMYPENERSKSMATSFPDRKDSFIEPASFKQWQHEDDSDLENPFEPSTQDWELSSFDGVVFPWEEEENEIHHDSQAEESVSTPILPSSPQAELSTRGSSSAKVKPRKHPHALSDEVSDVEQAAAALAYKKQYMRHNGESIRSILPPPETETAAHPTAVPGSEEIFIKDPVDGQLHPYDPENPDEVRKAKAAAKLFGTSAVSLYGSAPDGFHVLSGDNDPDCPFEEGKPLPNAAAAEMVKAAAREKTASTDDTHKSKKTGRKKAADKTSKKPSDEITYRKWSKQKNVAEDPQNHQMTLSELFASEESS